VNMKVRELAYQYLKKKGLNPEPVYVGDRVLFKVDNVIYVPKLYQATCRIYPTDLKICEKFKDYDVRFLVFPYALPSHLLKEIPCHKLMPIKEQGEMYIDGLHFAWIGHLQRKKGGVKLRVIVDENTYKWMRKKINEGRFLTEGEIVRAALAQLKRRLR